MIKATKVVFEYLHGMAFHRMLSMPSTFVALLITIATIAPEILLGAILWIVVVLPLILPLAMIMWLKSAWLKYVRSDFIFKRKMIILQVQIPNHITKSPKAMEVVFNDIINMQSEDTFITRWWNGGVRSTYSFELASIEGQLYFYIHCIKTARHYIESSIYAQYPDVEIFEAPDYTSGIYFDPNKITILAREFIMTKPDFYPIKTYVAYGLDKDPSKAEQRIDPLSSVFETLASVGTGEQMWLQILCRAYTESDLQEQARAEIDKIYDTLIEESLSESIKSKGKALLRPEQKEKVEALTNTLDKMQVEVGIRLLYLSKNNVFDSSRFGRPMKHLWRPFDSTILNSITGRSIWDHGIFDYPWQDYNNIRFNRISRMMLDAYRRRIFFNHPHIHRGMIMTTEELATIYHFPTEETKTPGLTRIQSKKGGAPPNLPT